MFWPRICRFRNNNQCFGQEYVDFATIGNVLAKNILISQQPAMFWERFGHDLECFGHVLAMFWAWFGHVLGMVRACVGHVLAMFWACLGHVLGMLLGCFGYV